MKSIPRVSIGMPTFNGEAWVGAAIESVLAQSWSDLELVIADNASTDQTEAICRDYAQRDERVRYHRNPENIGVARNFNRTFELALGPFFKWISCSDLISAEYVAECLRAYQERPQAILVYTGVRLFEDNPAVGSDCRDKFDLDIDDAVERFIRYTRSVRLNNIMHGLFRSEVLGNTRLYPNFIAADYNMIAECVLHGPVVQLPGIMHFRRMEEGAFSSHFSEEDLSRYYNPKNPKRISWWESRRLMDYYRIVLLDAPLTFHQRLRLLAYVMRYSVMIRHTLFAEFTAWTRRAN